MNPAAEAAPGSSSKALTSRNLLLAATLRRAARANISVQFSWVITRTLRKKVVRGQTVVCFLPGKWGPASLKNRWLLCTKDFKKKHAKTVLLQTCRQNKADNGCKESRRR